MEKDIHPTKNTSKIRQAEMVKLLEERERWRHFFEILRRKYLYIPLLVVLIYLIDNPDINILGYALKFFRGLSGVG